MEKMLESMLLELNQAKKIVDYAEVSKQNCCYTENVVNNAKLKVTILYYWANWCAEILNGELKIQLTLTGMFGLGFAYHKFIFVPKEI